jgi:hypothetical protein
VGRASIEVDDSQIRTLADQAKQQLEPVLATLDQLKDAAKNVPVVVSSEEEARPTLPVNVAGPSERLTMEASIESGKVTGPIRLESETAHIWLYPNEDGRTVRVETEAK